jgi:predicted enzyme related to lactoylglutathione lyase
MEWKLELVPIPVSDVDRAKSFYTDDLLAEN